MRDDDVDALLQERDRLKASLYELLEQKQVLGAEEWASLAQPLESRYVEVNRELGQLSVTHAYDIAEEVSYFLVQKVEQYRYIDRVATQLELNSQELSVEFGLTEPLLKSIALSLRIKEVAHRGGLVYDFPKKS